MYKKEGFTLIELIITIAIIALITAAVFVSVDPGKRIEETKDSQRWADIIALHRAVEKYTVDNGVAPSDFSSLTLEIGQKAVLCNSASELTCDGQTRSCALIGGSDFFGKYIGDLPIDPDKVDAGDTGYFITRGASNSLVLGVCDNDTVDIIVTSGVKMEPLSASQYIVQTSDVDFSAGSTSTAKILGSGDSASIILGRDAGSNFDVGDAPYGIAFATSTIWTANTSSNNVTQLNMDGSLVGTYGAAEGVGSGPQDIVFATSTMWVSNRNDNNVTQLNMDGSLVGTYNVGTQPLGITFATSTIWVANSGSNNVTQLNMDGSLVGTYNVGTSPRNIAFATSTIWVTNYISSNVTQLNMDGSLVGTYGIGTQVRDIIFVPHDDSIWVTGNNSTVIKLDMDGNIITTPAVTDLPYAIHFDSTTNSIWVTRFLATSVTKLDTDGNLIGAYPSGTQSRDITFSSSTDSMWIANTGDDDVTKMTVYPYSSPGIFISSIMDTTSNTSFGTMTWNEDTPVDTSISMKVRTDSSSDMLGAIAWSTCATVSDEEDISDNNCITDGHRYVQYQTTLSTADSTTSSALYDVSISYIE